MSKENKDSKKIRESVESVLSAADKHRKDANSWPTRLTCDVETFHNIHGATFGTFEDTKLNKQLSDAGVKTKLGNLLGIEVKAGAAVSVR